MTDNTGTGLIPVNSTPEVKWLTKAAMAWLKTYMPEGKGIYELSGPNSRVDVASVSPHKIVSVETKGSNDSVGRIRAQIKNHMKFCDEVFLLPSPVVSYNKRHLDCIMDGCGVLEIDKHGTIQVVESALKNTVSFDALNQSLTNTDREGIAKAYDLGEVKVFTGGYRILTCKKTGSTTGKTYTAFKIPEAGYVSDEHQALPLLKGLLAEYGWETALATKELTDKFNVYDGDLWPYHMREAYGHGDARLSKIVREAMINKKRRNEATREADDKEKEAELLASKAKPLTAIGKERAEFDSIMAEFKSIMELRFGFTWFVGRGYTV